MNKNIFFDGSIDQECSALCRAINSLPGCRIICSCCGHDKEPFEVIFSCSSPASLNLILLAAKIVDNPRYHTSEWSCTVWASIKTVKMPFIGITIDYQPVPEYSLISTSCGPVIYQQANTIAQTIKDLTRKSGKKLYKLHGSLKNGI